MPGATQYHVAMIPELLFSPSVAQMQVRQEAAPWIPAASSMMSTPTAMSHNMAASEVIYLDQWGFWERFYNDTGRHVWIHSVTGERRLDDPHN